ncbi:MAG TPA: glycoside hydrolase family 76 protein [Verrucomicrobiae bacterium]|nr:glycoside hydrolase family 76 protein [Verrucomicrobiae bacterium]
MRNKSKCAWIRDAASALEEKAHALRALGFRVSAVLTVAVAALAFFNGQGTSRGFVAADQQTMVNSFSNAFYFTSSGNRAYFRNTTAGGTTWFWGRANQMEMLIDLYEHTTNSVYLAQFARLYNGFVSDYGTDWIWNEFNDDIIWMVIACSRAYQKTGNTTYRDVAKFNFDKCYQRAWSPDLGGGLWWKSPLNTSKNACVNGPAAIASYLIYQNFNDTNYLNRAREIYLWLRSNLVNTNTGQVYDSIYFTGTKDQTPITYNEGTYIGAANYLGYTNDAFVAANYTRNNMGTANLLPNYDEHNDLGGFNGIFVRWMVKFMNDRNLQDTFLPWLQQNANAAWNVRRASDNLSWSKWVEQTPAGTRYSFGCWGSVLIINLVPPTQNPGGPAVLLAASDGGISSSYNSGLNWSDGAAPSWQKNYVVADARVLRTPHDNLHHSFLGSSLTLSNGGVLALKNTSGGRVLSIGTDLILDNGEIGNWAANSATLAGKITLRPGGGRIDSQGNATTITALIGGPGRLRFVANPSSAVNGTITLTGSNTYSGGTAIEAPHIVQLNGGTLGSPSSPLIFTNAGRGYGTLNLNGTDLSIGTLQGGGGTILNNKAGTTNVLTIGTGNFGGSVFHGLINNGAGRLALHKVGSGAMTLAGTSGFTGGTLIAGGTLQLGDGLSRNGSIGGEVTNNAALIFANPLIQTFSGTIRGSGAVTKRNATRLTFSMPCSYTGPTTIEAGTLALSGIGSVSNTASISIAADAVLDVMSRADQALTLHNGQSLLGGGNVNGSLHANVGSTIQPGPGIGTLTIQGGVTLKGLVFLQLSRATEQNSDCLAGTGMIEGGGTLTVVNAGETLEAGNYFRLFNQPVSGFASVNLPLLNPGLMWVDRLATDGSVQVVASAAVDATAVQLSAAEGGLTVFWPADHVGWRLQVQTNDSVTGLTGEWIDVRGSVTNSSMGVPVEQFGDNAFFRLVFP